MCLAEGQLPHNPFKPMTGNELTIEELKSVSGGLMNCEVKDTLPPVIPSCSPQVSGSGMTRSELNRYMKPDGGGTSTRVSGDIVN